MSSGRAPHHRPRQSSLLPSLSFLTSQPAAPAHEGWLYKQGGARGGRKTWKRRWCVLKEDCLYYKENKDSSRLLGVMPLVGSSLLDLGATRAPPPFQNEIQCHECTLKFSFTNRKHHCRNCGYTFCSQCASRLMPLPHFGYHLPVRICEPCSQQVELENEVQQTRVQQMLRVDAQQQQAMNAHVAVMKQLHRRRMPAPTPNLNYTVPSSLKPHLFAVKNSERELWLHAESKEERETWIEAIRNIQQQRDAPTSAAAAASNDLASPRGPDWEIDYSSITLLHKVGVGAFGEVYKARLWGTDIVVKTLKADKFKESEMVEELKKEVSILSQLRHPNVVLYIGACTKLPNVCIVTEWCSKGSLYDVLHDHSCVIDTKLLVDIAMGIAQGMNYLHNLEQKIIHRDLKSHNILLTKTFQVKVADFGLSLVRQSSEESPNQPKQFGIYGTPEWMAPEVMEGREYSEKVDVYSFGILLSELVTRQLPFHDLFNIKSYMDVVDAVLDQGSIPTIPKWCENLFQPLIELCTSRIENERPTFGDIIMMLREFSELDDALYYYQFDIPRIRELMYSKLPSLQSLAGNELSELLNKYPQIKRRRKKDGMKEREKSIININSSSLITARLSASSLPAPSSPSLPPTSAPPSLLNSLSSSTSTQLTNSLSSSSLDDSINSHGDASQFWVLDDADTFDLLERFTSLLSSSHRDVQLSSCRALEALLSRSKDIAEDRELVISCGGLSVLFTLLTSSQDELASHAGAVLLLLSVDPSSLSLGGFPREGLMKMKEIVDGERIKLENEMESMKRHIEQQNQLKIMIEQGIAVDDSSKRDKDTFKKPKFLRPKSNLKFKSTIEEGDENEEAENEHKNDQAPEAEDEEDDDDDDDNNVNEAADFAAVPSRARGTTATPLALTNTAAQSMMMSPKAPSAAMQPMYTTLLQELEKNETMPPSFADWFTVWVHQSIALYYQVESDEWRSCYLILCVGELRIFESRSSEPDEPLAIIRLSSAPRFGYRHGLPNCMHVEDCGLSYTLCVGGETQLNEWKSKLDIKPAGATTENEPTPASATQSMSHPSPASSSSASSAQVVPAAAAASPSSSSSSSSMAASVDPTKGVEVPELDVPTPPFLRKFPKYQHHGYLMCLSRTSNSPTYQLQYFLLNAGTLYVYANHKSSPNDIITQHETDPTQDELPSETNHFYIRLQSSSVRFDVWCFSAASRDAWLRALVGDRASSVTMLRPLPHIQAYANYYGHVDYYGHLYRKRKLTSRWLKEFIVLVDSEVHYYTSQLDPVDAPRGTFYICTASGGRAFNVQQSDKRPHCISIENPNRTFYLAAETEREYLGWVNAIHQNVKRLHERQQLLQRAAARNSLMHLRT